MLEGGGKKYPEIEDGRKGMAWKRRSVGWKTGSFIIWSFFFFHAFYFCLQTNKQSSPSVDSHERAGASLLQASNSFYSYILHSTSTTCCISNKKPSRLTFAARSKHAGSLSSLLACWLPSKYELALLPCRLTFRRTENRQCLSRVH